MRGILFLLIFLFGSCVRSESVDETALDQYIRDENNGLIKINNTDGFQLAMLWKPNDLIARQQIEKGTRSEYDSLSKYFSKYLYFTLSMSSEGKDLETRFGSDPDSFADKISFLSSEFSQNIRLTTRQDTLAPLECIYSRSFGMGTSNCLIVFEKPKSDDILIEIKGYPIGFGKQLFRFDFADIENAPKLKTKFL